MLWKKDKIIQSGFLLQKDVYTTNLLYEHNKFPIINNKFYIPFRKIEKEETIFVGDIREYIPFEWDTLYTFKPDVSIEKIYEVIGYKWTKITKATNKGMNQLVFLKDGKVVGYVYGYPKARKVFFDFGEYEGEYFTLTNKDVLNMDMSMNKKGIRTFKYVKPEAVPEDS